MFLEAHVVKIKIDIKNKAFVYTLFQKCPVWVKVVIKL
jgi:hypothetical protein